MFGQDSLFHAPWFKRFKGGGGSQPAPADPAATAQAQAAANKEAVFESAKVNQYNTQGPYGSTAWTGEIGEPDRTQTTTLDPQSQSVLEGQRNVAGSLTDFAQQYTPRVAQGLSTPFNTADIGQAPQANEQERARIEQSLMDRLEPRFQRDEEALQTRLANQGINQGSRAYSDAYGDFGQLKNDARLATVAQAGNEYARDFGMQNQAYNQQVSDALLNRTQGINEISALLQGTPAIGSPQTPQAAQYQIAPADVTGANALYQQGLMNNYNQQQARGNSMMGGLFGLGAAGITAASDRRVKTNVRRIGTMDNGLPVYTFTYITGGPMLVGVMAQDVEFMRPEAVSEVEGVKHVNYGAL
jgi:hypothetical protein